MTLLAYLKRRVIFFQRARICRQSQQIFQSFLIEKSAELSYTQLN